MYFNKYLIPLILTLTKCVYSLTLRGVTILSPPMITKAENNLFEGFAIDLLNEISRIVEFNYTLYVSPDEEFGKNRPGIPNGVIQELNFNRADFAIADLTKTQIRERFVDFTDPFMSMDLSALIRKDIIGNISTFEDLSNQNNFSYGIVRDSPTYRFMRNSVDSTLQRISRFIFSNGYNIVNTRQEGVDRALNQNYVFIQESVANDYARDQYCNLTVIEAEREYYPSDYSIALQKNSKYLDPFNKAIRQLKDEGLIKKLRKKYFETNCLSNSDMMSVNAKLDFITSMSLILSALISMILLH